MSNGIVINPDSAAAALMNSSASLRVESSRIRKLKELVSQAVDEKRRLTDVEVRALKRRAAAFGAKLTEWSDAKAALKILEVIVEDYEFELFLDNDVLGKNHAEERYQLKVAK